MVQIAFWNHHFQRYFGHTRPSLPSAFFKFLYTKADDRSLRTHIFSSESFGGLISRLPPLCWNTRQ